MTIALGRLSAAVGWGILSLASAIAAGASGVPDFTGVYDPINPFGSATPPPLSSGASGTGTRSTPPPPTRSAPTSDGRNGRPDNAPKLTPEYMAKWEIMRKSRLAGSPDYDPIVRCLPGGMPFMMNMVYGMEIQQTAGKVTIYGELNDMYRRVFLDGRSPSARVRDDPTYAGYSTGHWEGEVLLVETVALRGDTLIDSSFSPHSEQMTVRERLRFSSPGVLEDRITVNDPKALSEPYETVKSYRKLSVPKDELREFACAEGLASVK